MNVKRYLTGSFKVGKVKVPYLAVFAVGLLGAYLWKRHKASSSAGAAIDPATGFPYGSPEDLAALQALSDQSYSGGSGGGFGGGGGGDSGGGGSSGGGGGPSPPAASPAFVPPPITVILPGSPPTPASTTPNPAVTPTRTSTDATHVAATTPAFATPAFVKNLATALNEPTRSTAPAATANRFQSVINEAQTGPAIPAPQPRSAPTPVSTRTSPGTASGASQVRSGRAKVNFQAKARAV